MKSTYRCLVLVIALGMLLSTSLVSAQVIEAPEQEIIPVTRNNQTFNVVLPRKSIKASQVAVLANLQDVQSVNTAQYYAQVRNIPVENVIYLSFVPGRQMIRENEFNTLKQQVDSSVDHLADIQAYVITWTEPWAVYQNNLDRGMSITSAFTLGFNPKYYNDIRGSVCEATSESPLFNSSSYRPYTDFGIRPAMMLGGTNSTYVRSLIDRGKAADATFPAGHGYLIRTTDSTRSIPRYSDFMNTVKFWNKPNRIAMTLIDNSTGTASNVLVNKPDVLFYSTGLSSVAQLTSNTFVPGGIGDHLTSFGGRLTGSAYGQMSSLRWLEAGATGTYGTIEEPCAFTQKFPAMSFFTRHYFSGATLIEAYWKSVLWPGEGVFVGDPLSRPYGYKISINEKGIELKTSTLNPRRLYSFWGADNINGPFIPKKLVSKIVDENSPVTRTIEIPATKPFLFLKEQIDPSMPTEITIFQNNGFSTDRLVPATNGQKVIWQEYNAFSSTSKLWIYDLKSQQRAELPVMIDGVVASLFIEGTKIVFLQSRYVERNFVMELYVYDLLTQEKKFIANSLVEKGSDSRSGAILNVQVNQGRVFWSQPNRGIMLCDLSTIQPRQILAGATVQSFNVKGNRIALTYQNDPLMQVTILDLLTLSAEPILHKTLALRFLPQVTDSAAYWLELNGSQTYNVREYNFQTKETKTLFSINEYKYFKVSEGWIAAVTRPAGAEKYVLYAYNMARKKVSVVKTAKEDYLSREGQEDYPVLYGYDVSGSIAVWVNRANDEGRVFIYTKNFLDVNKAISINSPLQKSE